MFLFLPPRQPNLSGVYRLESNQRLSTNIKLTLPTILYCMLFILKSPEDKIWSHWISLAYIRLKTDDDKARSFYKVLDSCLPRLAFSGRNLSFEAGVPAKQGSAHQWWLFKERTDPRTVCGLQHPMRTSIRLHCTITQVAVRSHTKYRECNCSQHRIRRSMHRNYTRFKLGGGQAYNRSSDWAVDMELSRTDMA